ncbi:MAG TPA: L-threonylcarbamoyladenylate synthase [Gemmatimonadales bacterium]|nr:L-threonylcarbamoyladenylate synthase [Gemmatimonadales bacterium]
MTTLAFHTKAEWEAAAPVVKDHLGRGGLLAYPTETVYGLGSRARAADVAALAKLKGRPPRKPFLLLVASRAMVEDAGLVFNAAADALAEAFWPGPMTIILPGGIGLPDVLRGPEGGVAVRWTSQPGMRTVIDRLGEPITSTSANRPGGPTAPGVGAIETTFEDAVTQGTLLILDGGTLGNVPPSTLIDCTTMPARLVREGAIPRDEVRARVGSLAP